VSLEEAALPVFVEAASEERVSEATEDHGARRGQAGLRREATIFSISSAST
jgi:hypothetical protein